LDLYREFQHLVQELDRAGVDYAVVGALAVAIWGAPRATTDIDVLVSQDQVEAAIRVAEGCGFTLPALPMKFRDGTEVRRFSKVEGGQLLTLDFLLANDTLLPAWQSRQRIDGGEGPIWVVSRDALIQMKVTANRQQDLFDVERLKEADR
jgi:hypothetical protein